MACSARARMRPSESTSTAHASKGSLGGEGACRARRRRSRPALSHRHRPVSAAHEGRRGPPRPADRAGQHGPRGAARRRQGAHADQEARAAAHRPPGRRRAAHVRAVEPPARGVDREEVPGVGPPAPRPDPGGQPRPDARGREVRLAQGLQVLHVRDVVDPPGDHARHRQHRPHDPAPRPRRRHAGPAAEGAVRAWS